MTKNIAIVGSVGIPPIYGGFETLTHNLSLNLDRQFTLTVYCSSMRYLDKPRTIRNTKLTYIPLNANGIQSIPYDIWSILHGLRKNDTFLILGVASAIILPFLKIFTRKKFIVHIDGLEWKRAKWGFFARKFLKISESFAVKYAHNIIVDNAAMQTYINAVHDRDTNLIEYGANHVRVVNLPESELEEYEFINGKYALSVCRIEKENNIHLILEAFSNHDKLPLVFIGNWDDNQYGRDLKAAYQKFDHIYLLNPIYELDRLNNLRCKAYIYIHGHSAGGTNPSLVEAMYLNLPIFSYDVIYNRLTTEDMAVFFKTSDDLTKELENIQPEKLDKIANSLKEIAERRYNWKKISDKFAELF